MENCLFCKFVNKEVAAEIVFENDKILAFNDLKPIAPVHVLLIPKKHISRIDNLEVQDKELIGDLFLAVKEVAKKEGISETGYRLIINIGKNAGQTIDHLHLHLLGGKKLPWD